MNNRTINCPRCGQDKPQHTCFANTGTGKAFVSIGSDDREVPVELYVRNVASKEGRTDDAARCAEVCYDCFQAAGGKKRVPKWEVPHDS